MRGHNVFLSSISILGCLLPLTATIALADSQPDVVSAPVEKVYVPLGFDDNDNVEIVLHGHFNSSCYKVGPTTARVDYETQTIHIDSKAYLYREGTCAQMIVPFTETVSIGLVKEGSYQIVLDDARSLAGAVLEIKAATSNNPDDFLYAPVDAVKLDAPRGEGAKLTVEGRYPHMFIGCMVIRDLKIQKARGNVIVVQPIAALTDGQECESQSLTKKFIITKSLDFPVEKTEYLLHARATSGHSVNRLVEVE